LQDFQLEQQQQQRRARSLRTPALELLSFESKKKATAAAGNSNDNFVASLVPEDIHTGLSIHFMKSSEIYARIRAIRSNPTRREEQRVLAEEISTMRKVPIENTRAAPVAARGTCCAWARMRLLIFACFRVLAPPPAPRMAR
jgi:hypothetical protein